MKPVVIAADSTCDLSPELLERYQIETIPLIIILGDEVFPDGAGFTPEDMYRRYRQDGTLPKTAARSSEEYAEFFAPFLAQGSEVVYIGISSELSGSCNAARLAAEELEGVYVVDSRMLSSGIGLLVLEGAECRERGMGAKEIADHLTGLTEKVEASFVLDTLEFMQKGGRCSNFALMGANLLKLKPALEMRNGTLQVYKKYRGNIEKVYRQYIIDRLQGKKIRPGHVFITESGETDPQALEELMDFVAEATGAKDVHHTLAGCTVSSHCGPKTLGVLFIRE